MMHLDVLPRGDVALAKRDVLLDPGRERIQLVGSHAAQRQLDPDHLNVWLSLAVHALLEPELDELIALQLALQEARRLRVEVIELALKDGDNVARDVLEDLGVLKRALAGTHPTRRAGRGAFALGAVD